jgi:hypothetical protein
VLSGGVRIGRRAFLAGAAAAVAAPAAAEIACTPFTGPAPWGIQRCVVGIPSVRVLGAGQECRNWCWAACIQSLFATGGFIIRDQRRIVAALFGRGDICASATGAQIVGTIARDWQADDGRWFRADALPLMDLSLSLWRPDVAQIVSNDLAAGFPLINGAVGHATLMTAMTYLRDHRGNGMVEDITVRDPFVPRGQPAVQRSLTPLERQGTFFVAQVRVYG